jgi:hypothetical protein
MGFQLLRRVSKRSGENGRRRLGSHEKGDEIEAGDDFVLTQQTLITGAAFTGLIPLGASTSDIKNVVVEVYRVFPADSDVNRTSGPPTFSTPNVPTRVNSPSDVAFREREISAKSPGLAAIVLECSRPRTASSLAAYILRPIKPQEATVL